MSYDHNIYVGWYAEFNKSDEKIEVGVKYLRYCPNSKKHFAKDKFCPSCGVLILAEEQKVYQSYGLAYHILDERDENEIKSKTLGNATLEDIKKLEGSYSIFPDFLGTDKSIILAPGYTKQYDISRSDGFVKPISIADEPSQEWQDLITKVFHPQNLKIKFGMILEIV